MPKTSKSDRMELRRSLGGRKLPDPPVRGSRGIRKIAFACFRCRISVKREAAEQETAVCARCGGTLHRMGWSFHAPASTDIEQWEKVQTLFAEGFRFFGTGDMSHEALPDRLRDVPAFLKRNPTHRLRVAPRQPELLP